MIAEERRARERSTGPGWIATAGGALFLVALGFSVGLVAGTAYQEPELVAEHLAGRTTEVVLDPEAAQAPDVAAPAPVEAPTAAIGEGALDAEPDEHARASGAERTRELVPRSEPTRGFASREASEGDARASGAERTRELVPRSEPTRGFASREASEGDAGLGVEAEPAAPAVEAAAAQGEAATAEGFSIQVGAFGSEKAARQLAGELGKRGYTTFLMDEGEGARFKVRIGPVGSRAEAERLSERLRREQRLPTWILAAGAAQQRAP